MARKAHHKVHHAKARHHMKEAEKHMKKTEHHAEKASHHHEKAHEAMMKGAKMGGGNTARPPQIGRHMQNKEIR